MKTVLLRYQEHKYPKVHFPRDSRISNLITPGAKSTPRTARLPNAALPQAFKSHVRLYPMICGTIPSYNNRFK